MGELARALMEHTIHHTLVELVDDTLQTSRILHNIAGALAEEPEYADIANAAQLREASVRCIDLIELVIEAATSDMDAYRKSRVAKELESLRKGILDV
jgi:hypothetical protein